jgi:hypothetical protein
MEPSDLLRHVARAIEGLGLRYFVTGSMVTIFYGEPRFTNDIDVVVDYYRQGGSEKHLRDIAGVLKTSPQQIDTGYIAQWAQQMGLGGIWTAIQERMARGA